MGSERQQRKVAKEIAPYPIEAESALFTFKGKSGGEEFRMAPIASVEDLCHLVEFLLEENVVKFHLKHTLIKHEGSF